MGVFLGTTAIFGTIGSLIIGIIIDDFNISSQEKKGWLIAINTAIPCLFAAFFFYISSIHYAEYRATLVQEKAEAEDKASAY